MDAEQLAVNVRVLEPGTWHGPPGEDPGWGHCHKTIEEIYLVLEGELQVKLADEVETLRQYDAVRIPPGTVRAARNETDGRTVFAMISRRVDDPRAESVPHPGFWAD